MNLQQKDKKKSENKKLYQVEYKHVRVLRIFYMVLSIVLFAGFFASGYFVYNNVFRSLEQVNTIVILKSELDLKTIPLPRLEAVAQHWKERNALREEGRGTLNPFDVQKFDIQEVSFSPTSTPSTTSPQIEVPLTIPVESPQESL